MRNLKVLIAGGGIGGLTTALCLAQQGFEIEVFEQAAEFGEIGAGLQLSPNCSGVLHALGLEDALKGCAFLPEATQFRSWRNGRVIAENHLGDRLREQYGAPYYHIHRGDLLSLLVAAARKRPNICLHTSSRVSTISQTDQGVSLRLGSSQHHGDVLIGADGIHSVVRAALWGDQQPRFTGNIAWRAVVPAARLPADLIRPMSTAWWGPHKHFVHYYVRCGELINCVCVVEKEGWQIESWTEAGEHAELKADFVGWHDDIQQLIDNMDPASLFKWALHDRDPMKQWGNGRVTLLGDACHPTLPFMAQGAAMAIEDAAVLARCLADDVAAAPALQRYESLRKARTASIQNGSRRNAKVFHLSGVKAWMRNRAVRAAGSRTMDRLYAYNPLEVTKGTAARR